MHAVALENKVWRDGRFVCKTTRRVVLAKINFMQSVSWLGRCPHGFGMRFFWAFQVWAAATIIKPSFASRPRRLMSTLLRGCPGAAAERLTRARSFTPMETPTRAQNISLTLMQLAVMLDWDNMFVSMLLKLPQQIPRCWKVRPLCFINPPAVASSVYILGAFSEVHTLLDVFPYGLLKWGYPKWMVHT